MAAERHTWWCCDKTIHTPFCPECGASRPSETTTVEAEILTGIWRRDARAADRNAATLEQQAEELGIEHRPDSPIIGGGQGETVADVIRGKLNTAAGFRKRAEKLRGWADTVQRLIDRLN